jgi:hypothetical protein
MVTEEKRLKVDINFSVSMIVPLQIAVLRSSS